MPSQQPRRRHPGAGRRPGSPLCALRLHTEEARARPEASLLPARWSSRQLAAAAVSKEREKNPSSLEKEIAAGCGPAAETLPRSLERFRLES